MADDIPEQVYLDAARASDELLFARRPLSSTATVSQSKHPGFRAAVESAYRAGQAAAPDALPEPERAVVEAAKAWRNTELPEWRVSDSHERALVAAVDALTDATPAAGQDGAAT